MAEEGRQGQRIWAGAGRGISPIHALDRVLGVTHLVEGDEGEAARLVRLAVLGEEDVRYVPELLEGPDKTKRESRLVSTSRPQALPPPSLPWSFCSTCPPPPERSECAASPRGTRPPPRPCSTTGRAHRRPPRATYPLSRGWCAGHTSRGWCALTARRGRTCGQRPGRSRSSARRRRSWHPRCARSLRPHREEAARGDKWLAQRFKKGTERGRRTGARPRSRDLSRSRELDLSRSRRGGGLRLRESERERPIGLVADPLIRQTERGKGERADRPHLP